MIKNIIFDLGGVLLGFTPQKYLEHIGLNEEEVNLFKKLIWGSETWYKCDRGDYTYEETIEIICKRNPEYAEKLRYILENKDNSFILSEKEDSCKYARELKDRGFNIYFLSNINQVDLKFNKESFRIFEIADGAVYSSDIKFAKPEKECYEALFNKYNLKKDESIFIDDNLKNIEVAISLGINSVLYNNLDEAKIEIENIINKLGG